MWDEKISPKADTCQVPFRNVCGKILLTENLERFSFAIDKHFENGFLQFC